MQESGTLCFKFHTQLRGNKGQGWRIEKIEKENDSREKTKQKLILQKSCLNLKIHDDEAVCI